MSKRLLLLAMSVLLSVFVAVGCGSDGSDGKDGKDASIDDSVNKLEKEKEAVANAVSGAYFKGPQPGSGNAGNLADLAYDLVVSAEDLKAEINGGFAELTFTINDGAGSGFDHYKSFNSLYFMFETDTDEAEPKKVVVRGNVLAGNVVDSPDYAFTQPNDGSGVYKIKLPKPDDAAVKTSSRVRGKFATYSLEQLYDILENDKDVRILITFTNDDTDLEDNSGWYRYYLNVQGDRDFGKGTFPKDLFTNETCASCHGDKIFNRGNNSAKNADGTIRKSTHGYHYAVRNAENCSVCHGYTGKDPIGTRNPDQTPNTTTIDNHVLIESSPSSLPKYVHAIHSSSSAKSTYDIREIKDGVNYAIGYPLKSVLANKASLEDCGACHAGNYSNNYRTITDDKYFNYNLCITCHAPTKDDKWAGWKWENSARKDFHESSVSVEEDCTGCHGNAVSKSFNKYHKGWDPYSAEAQNYKYVVDSVTLDKETNRVSVEWSVVNPSNDVKYKINLKEPTATNASFVKDDGSLRLILTPVYGKGTNLNEGDFDWTNEGVSRGRVAYGSVVADFNMETTFNTDGTVATTEYDYTADEEAGENVGALAFQGSPVGLVAGETVALPVETLVQPYQLADGKKVARRAIIDDASCASCHGPAVFHINADKTIGLYRGAASLSEGGRGLEMCGVCHNTNSVNTNANGEIRNTDYKYMIHRIHSVSETGVSFGGYAGTSFQAKEGMAPSAGKRVFYPKALSDCESCHIPGTYNEVPKANLLALTVIRDGVEDTPAASSSDTSRTDDYVVGPAYATCASCHTGHYDNGLTKHAQSFAMGTFAEPMKVNKLEVQPAEYEACGTCHTSVHTSW